MHFIAVTDIAFLPWKSLRLAQHLFPVVELTVEIYLRRRVNLLIELIFIRDRTCTVSPAGLTSAGDGDGVDQLFMH